MPLILNIDTATENASVGLGDDDKILAIEKSENAKEHASFLQPAIKKIMHEANLQLQQLNAIAVTGGPGSYTGLRVGLSSAKGLCYALNKPLILINTLEVMAFAAIKEFQNNSYKTENNVAQNNFIFCPMIDARRMEVFTAIYNQQLEILAQPASQILDENSFAAELTENQIIFSGSGSGKFQNIISNSCALFSTVQYDATHLATLSARAFVLQKFSDPAYAEPMYLKEFFTTFKKK
jgi:tRNA threonylcarbamoyladenosine biosynthesis protein TsaB